MKPKWFKDDDVAIGDVVLFLKQDDDFAGNYQYGMIESVKRSNDGKIRSVDVKYRNHSGNFSRTTHRAVRKLVMIHHIDELNIFTELGEIAIAADVKRKLQLENNDITLIFFMLRRAVHIIYSCICFQNMIYSYIDNFI